MLRIALTTAVFAFIGGGISLYHYGIQKLDFLVTVRLHAELFLVQVNMLITWGSSQFHFLH